MGVRPHFLYIKSRCLHNFFSLSLWKRLTLYETMGNRENVWAGSVVISSSSTYSDSFLYSRPNIHTFATHNNCDCASGNYVFYVQSIEQLFSLKLFLRTAKRMLCHSAFILICFYQKLVLYFVFPLIILTTAKVSPPTCVAPRRSKKSVSRRTSL